MTAALGHFCLALALGVAIVQFCLPMWGLYRRQSRYFLIAEPAAVSAFVLSALAFSLLMQAFIQYDFSIAYVAGHSNLELPLLYRISAVWGGHEGSLLLWILMLNGWGLAVALRARALPLEMRATVLAVLGGVSIGFLLFTLLTSNPFARVFPVPADGADLNPLLQDPGLAIHPPMLYMGYVGFSVAFAFAIAALLHGRLDAAWVRWTRPWTTSAWAFLSLGIMLGSWWAYNELGWGGWWFWDPVENASFMPWLVGTALIHSLAATEKRKVLGSWTVLLAISAFALSLLGTFLVRSGVLVSVHAFATDPERGVFILAFLAVVIGGSLTLFGLRGHLMSASNASLRLFSREGLLLFNNLFLLTAAFTVLLGTLYPLIVDALGLPKPSVGPPWYNLTFVPIMMPLLLLVGFVYGLSWWRGDRQRMLLQARWPALGAVILGSLLPFTVEELRGVGVYAALVLACWVMLTAFWDLARLWRQGAKISASVWGMCLAHAGLGVFAIGVAMVSHGEVEKDLALKPGQSVHLAGYDWTFHGARVFTGPNYDADIGRVSVRKDGELIAELEPAKRVYRSQPNNPMTESSVDVGVLRDLYVSMAEPLGEGAWGVRVYYKPYIRWIWFGVVLMALGGFMAAADKRYRVRQRESAKLSAAAA